MAEPPCLENWTATRKLGEGAFGNVYLGTTREGKPVAIKFLKAERTKWVSRFQREAEALQRLSHPDIVCFLGAGEATDADGEHWHYLVTEYFDGIALEAYLAKVRQCAEPVAPDFLFDIVARWADALAHAADADILHRDVKPANIMLSHDLKRVMVIDFGLHRDLARSERSTTSFDQIGQLEYCSPEKIRDPHEVDDRDDVYSLGVVVYYGLAGVLPVTRTISRADVQERVASGAIEPLRALRPDLPLRGQLLVQRMMHHYRPCRPTLRELPLLIRNMNIAIWPPDVLKERLAWAVKHRGDVRENVRELLALETDLATPGAVDADCMRLLPDCVAVFRDQFAPWSVKMRVLVLISRIVGAAGCLTDALLVDPRSDDRNVPWLMATALVVGEPQLVQRYADTADAFQRFDALQTEYYAVNVSQGLRTTLVALGRDALSSLHDVPDLSRRVKQCLDWVSFAYLDELGTDDRDRLVRVLLIYTNLQHVRAAVPFGVPQLDTLITQGAEILEERPALWRAARATAEALTDSPPWLPEGLCLHTDASYPLDTIPLSPQGQALVSHIDAMIKQRERFEGTGWASWFDLMRDFGIASRHQPIRELAEFVRSCAAPPRAGP